jgi:hypothetical protein
MAVGWRGQYYRYRELSMHLLALYRQRNDLQAFLEIILSLATLIVFIVFALKPTALTMVSLNKEIDEKKSTLDTLNQKIDNLQTANNLYVQNQDVIPDINAAIFTAPKPDTFSKQIVGIAQRNSVDLVGMSIGQVAIFGKPPTKISQTEEVIPLPEGAESMEVSITVKGSYSDLIAFLRDLENLRIPIKVDTLNLSTSTTEPGVTELITGRVPYLGQK